MSELDVVNGSDQRYCEEGMQSKALPIRTYSFEYIVHADFINQSSQAEAGQITIGTGREAVCGLPPSVVFRFLLFFYAFV